MSIKVLDCKGHLIGVMSEVRLCRYPIPKDGLRTLNSLPKDAFVPGTREDTDNVVSSSKEKPDA